MKLTIVRHGRTLGNDYDIFQSENELLSPQGFEQSKYIATALKNEQFDMFYSSDSLRAVQTSAEIAKYQKNRIVFDKLLRERNPGVLTGGRVKNIRPYILN